MLKSDLCDFNDAYIFVKGDVTLEGHNDANKQNKNLVFKNNAPFINCVSKINGVKIDNAEDLDVAMPMYNLLEYSKKIIKKQRVVYGVITEMNQIVVDDDDNITHSILNSESFDYKASFMENGVTHDNLTKNDVKVVVPLKHLSNFWRSLNIPLINCEVELILTWSKNCVLADMTRRNAQGNNPAIVPPAEITLK